MRKLCLLISAAAATLISAPAAADPVTDWWEVARRQGLASITAPGPRMPETERASTRTALAVFEAVNSIDRRYESYLGFPQGDSNASQDAAAATAAFNVLLVHYPASRASLEESYGMAMALIPDGPAKESGRQIGQRAAEAAAGARGIDPSIPQEPYRPQTAPGEWIGGELPMIDVYWAAFTPWVARNHDELRPPPPPQINSDRYARDYEEVRRLGGRASTERTPQQTLIARYRQGYDLSPMVRYITDRPGRTQVENARLLALYQMAGDDAVQAMAMSKHQYRYWRPITAIRNADRDDNPQTERDPAWAPLLPTPKRVAATVVAGLWRR